MNCSFLTIIQARMGSTRLPGKVLLDLNGFPVLAHVVSRVKKASNIDKIIVATSVNKNDDPIVEWCNKNSVLVFRGSENDVLTRFAEALGNIKCQGIVRITADCPAIDPIIIDRVIAAFRESSIDYASNTLQRTYPHGMDVEVIHPNVLLAAYHNATEPFEREHVTPYVWRRPEQYRLLNVSAPHSETMPDLRVTLDTPYDYLLLRAIFSLLDNSFSCSDLTNLIYKLPWLKEINKDIIQKPVFADHNPLIRETKELLFAANYCVMHDLFLAGEQLAKIALQRIKGEIKFTYPTPQAVKALILHAEDELK